MPTCNRSISSTEHDKKIHDNSSGSISITTSQKVQITGLVIRRLFKTLSCDFDVPLDAVVSIQDMKGTNLGSLDISEDLEPSKKLYEALRVAAKNYMGFGVLPVPDWVAKNAFGTYLEKFSGECSEKEIRMIKSVYDDPSKLRNPPDSACDSRFKTVPMANGHYGHYDFKNPIVLIKDEAYVIHATIRRRGWYHFLHEEKETVKCEGVEFNFGPISNSAYVNSFLSGIKFTKI